MNFPSHQPDAQRDLVLERLVDLPAETIWAAWTKPELLVQWFTPAPWRTVGCEIDLKPGGAFKTVMRSPEGQEFPSTGVYLEVVPNQRLVWTNALAPGFRPAIVGDGSAKECDSFGFTGAILLEPADAGTRYTAVALHATASDCKRHADMGFEQGWGAALDQLVALMRSR